MFAIMLSEKIFFGCQYDTRCFITSMADRMVNLAVDKGSLMVISDAASPLQRAFAIAAIKAALKTDIHLILFASDPLSFRGNPGEYNDFRYIFSHADKVIRSTSDAPVRRSYMRALADLIIEVTDPPHTGRPPVSFSLDEFSGLSTDPRRPLDGNI